MDQTAGLTWNTREQAAEKRSYRVDLGCGIAALRLRRRLTRKALASHLGVTAKLLGCWERGVRRPPFEKLVELCRVLRATVEDLLDAGETRRAYLLRGHKDSGASERRSDMSEETSVTTGEEVDPGIASPEPGLKSERVQDVAPEPVPGPVQAG